VVIDPIVLIVEKPAQNITQFSVKLTEAVQGIPLADAIDPYQVGENVVRVRFTGAPGLAPHFSKIGPLPSVDLNAASANVVESTIVQMGNDYIKDVQTFALEHDPVRNERETQRQMLQEFVNAISTSADILRAAANDKVLR